MTGITVRPHGSRPVRVTYGPAASIKLVVVPGPVGPPGPASGGGGGSGSDLSHHHVQSTASAEWTVTHGLGFRPNVQVTDTSGSLFEGDVQHLSLTVTRLRFSAPFAGEARFS